MSSRKAPEGPFPYPTTSEWAEHLYEAISNTCAAEGFAPVPRQAVLEGLAPALGRGEAKRVIERRRDGSRFLRATACSVEQRDSDGALLVLRVDLHGAATLPWVNNDRTRSEWLHPSADNQEQLEDLVVQQKTVASWTVGLERVKTGRRGRRRLAATATPAEKDAAVAAVKMAEDELARVQQGLEACEQALGGRRPLPVVQAVVEDGVPLAALTTETVSTEMAAEVQRYAVEMLRRRARLRTYDLAESLVQEGQRDSTVVVLQRTPVTDRHGEQREIWRGQQATGANRADARLDIFGISAQQLLTGVPQSLLRLPGEEENRRMVVQGLGEVLRRISFLLNAEYADPERDPEGRAQRAVRIGQVPARVVVGARKPERLEESLRQLNVHEHLRGQLDFEDMDRALGLWSTLVKAYQAKGLLGELLAQEVAHGRVSVSELDEEAIADALVGARALDALKVLLPLGDEVSPVTLRDVAIRCTTVMVFPPIPQVPAPHGRVSTGRYWPVVRACLQEAPWRKANGTGARTRRRTDIWAAVVAQHFLRPGPLAAAEGLFGKHEVQFGARPDARSLASLLTACRQGDAMAWETLVRRHLPPGMISGAEPFITPNQGSFKSADRKGVRRAPANAVQALVNAYTDPPQGVTRELLLAFAEAVLRAPDSPVGDGLAPGAFWAPDAHGDPREGVLADKEWFDALFPLTSVSSAKRQQPPAHGVTGAAGQGSSVDTVELDDEIPDTPLTRMTRLRAELASAVASSTVSATAVAEEIGRLLEIVEDAVRARDDAGGEKEPADVRALYVEDFNRIKAEAAKIAPLLDKATVAVMSL